jgi:hypothetical protein
MMEEYRSIRGRKFPTKEQALQDNRDYADEMIAADQLAAEQERQFTSPSGCQVWLIVILLLLTIAFPYLWFLWWGLACLFFRRLG